MARSIQRLGSVALFDSLRQQWSDAIAAFNAAMLDLDNAETQLYSVQELASQDPADYAEWQAHFNKLNAIKSTVQRLQEIAGTVSGWWGSVTGTFGLSGARKRGIAGSLGLGPAVPILAGISVSGFLLLVGKLTAVAAAIYGFYAYLTDKSSRGIAQRTDELIEQGLDPAKASEIARGEATTAAQTSTGYQFVSTINKTLLVAAFGIAAIFVLPKLLNK